MNWIKCKKADIDHMYCVDSLREDWRVMFALKDYVPENAEDDSDCMCICGSVKGYPSDWDIKQLVIKAQEEYDKSEEVNSFYVNGKLNWLDKATRVGLANSLSVLESAGKRSYTLWFDNTPYTISIAGLKQLLESVELYAMECNAITRQHLAEIENLRTREDYFHYDITAGYPEKLSFELSAK